ncbi:MAG: hypothetical protein ACREI8_15970, partial [Myxococcota bacterium]
MLRGLFAAYLRRRFAWLLALLLVAIGIDPVLEAMGRQGRALEWMLALGLAAAVPGAWRSRGSRFFVLGLGAALATWLALHVARFGSG